MPRVNVEEADITAKYKITDIDSGSTTSYFGFVDADGAWYIMELTDTQARYARGVGIIQRIGLGEGGFPMIILIQYFEE